MIAPPVRVVVAWCKYCLPVTVPLNEQQDDETIVPEWRLDPLRYSSWHRLCRVQAWVYRFLENSRRKREERQTGELTPDELQQVQNIIISESQKKAFPEEYRAMTKGKPIGKSSKILGLFPRIDDEGVIRCNGRLKHAEFLSFDTRHPVILPRKDHVTKLIVKSYHEQGGHITGVNQTLAALSSRFWIVAGREEIRDWERDCNECGRRKCKVATQIMAPLPKTRVKTSVRAFTRTSVDFGGPFITKQLRGRVQSKRYLCLFTCMASQAVHLEMAYGLDTDSFLNAFNRMVNRRGVPEEVTSDNGTNFVAGNKELNDLVENLDQDKISRATARRGVKWYFNPPLGPHFGGVHESLIKSAKKAIYAVLGKADINDEELATAISGAEALLNSRPLTYQAADSQDTPPLTPNHFLFGQVGGQFAPEAVDSIKFNPRRRWRVVQQLIKHVWERWLKEWLPMLHPRAKWREEMKNLESGDLVVVVSPNTPRGQWPLGRILQVLPGKDDHVRVAKVKIGDNEFLRPISRLCPLRCKR
ncbi:uncharacterized protein LOC135498663 [Lineus longissimus]|uniref:uncharacterized protein LOC135498663 n=1 Tax=Lineus longissimus TaxID=88925 RepID=UPI00315D304F